MDSSLDFQSICNKFYNYYMLSTFQELKKNFTERTKPNMYESTELAHVTVNAVQ
jgi:hypothetical protein